MKPWLKVLAVAVGGAAVKVTVDSLPMIQNTKYGPAVLIGLTVAGAYASKSPLLAEVLAAAQSGDGQTNGQPSTGEGK